MITHQWPDNSKVLYAFGQGNKLEDVQVLRAEDQKDK